MVSPKYRYIGAMLGYNIKKKDAVLNLKMSRDKAGGVGVERKDGMTMKQIQYS